MDRKPQVTRANITESRDYAGGRAASYAFLVEASLQVRRARRRALSEEAARRKLAGWQLDIFPEDRESEGPLQVRPAGR